MRTAGCVPCIRANTAGDHLCDACRDHCHQPIGTGMVPFIVGFGPAFHFSPPRQEPADDELEPLRYRLRDRVRLSDSVHIDGPRRKDD